MSPTPPAPVSSRALPAPARAGGGTQRLSRKQKAAVIVRLLLNEGADVPIITLPEDMQASLTTQMGSMNFIDRATLAEVVKDFADELDSVGLSMPRGIADALKAMDGKISPRTAARLRKEAGVRQSGDPWDRLRALEVKELVPFAMEEAIEVAAVMLSKLDVAKSAELLSELPGERARRITYAISMTGAVTPDAVDRIGLSLASQLDNKPERAFEEEPVKRVGDLLNFSASATRDDMLVGLDEEDQEFANEVRKAIFTFAHIPERIEARDIPKVVRGVDQADLVVALAAAKQTGLEEAATYVLENMSKRMAESLQEEMAEAGKIRTKDGETAMGLLVAAIRQLQADGEITLKVAEEDGEED